MNPNHKMVLNLSSKCVTLILELKTFQKRLFAALLLKLGILDSGPTLTLTWQAEVKECVQSTTLAIDLRAYIRMKMICP